MLRRRSLHLHVVLPVLLVSLFAARAADAWPGLLEVRSLARSLIGAGFLPPSGGAAQRIALGPEGEIEVQSGSVAILLDQFLVHALRQDSEGLVEVHHPDGSVSIDLEGRYQSASVATIGTKGVVVTCASGHGAVSRCLHAPADSTVRWEEQ